MSVRRLALGLGAAVAAIGVMASAALLGFGNPLTGGGGGGGSEGAGEREGPAVAVELAPIEVGSITEQRTFNGTLRPSAQFTVAPRVGGRIEQLLADIGDAVPRGGRVAVLDDDEFVQSVREAEAELAVARAEHDRAREAQRIAQRNFDRVKSLREQGIASASELDQVETEIAARQAETAVTAAQVNRREALLDAARIRRDYTEIHATWRNGAEGRIVGERFIEEGDTVSPNEPLLSVLDIDTLIAVVTVTERDYMRLSVGQRAQVVADAVEDEPFDAEVRRLSPQFRRASRQAVVEVEVPNEGHRLKPGMFVRVLVDLGRSDDATIIPRQALARREGRHVLFVADEQRQSVRMVPVEVRLIQGERAHVEAEGLEGEVVVLGQHLLSDGSRIHVPDVTRPQTQAEVAAP